MSGFVAGTSGMFYPGRMSRLRWGGVEEVGGRLQMTTQGEYQSHVVPIPVELIPVRWGDRLYLLAPDQLLRFCNEVNRGYEQRREGSSFLHRGTHGPAQGKPELPPPYDGYILDQPLTATVVEVLDIPAPNREGSTRLRVRARLDIGRRNHAFEGMELGFLKESIVGWAKVESIDDATCEAVVVYRTSTAGITIEGAELSTSR